MQKEFQEIGHSGGKLTIKTHHDPVHGSAYQLSYSGSRPNPVVMTALYVLPPGYPIAPIAMGGIGSPIPPPPIPGAVMVLLASDSQGLFGHRCGHCERYWRGDAWPIFCPYCGTRDEAQNFLSDASRRFIEHFCEVLAEALANEQATESVIDMDAVADAVQIPDNRPSFFIAEESQQHRFRCDACNAVNDIIGTYGYCSECATRNDVAVLEKDTFPTIRERLKQGNAPEDCIRDAVAAMDSFIGQYANQLAQRVPMLKARQHRLANARFHDMHDVTEVFSQWFGINLLRGIKAEEASFAKLMFHRRHIYEHKGGEADEKYIRESGESGVRLKQRLRNSQEDAHRLLGILQRLATNLHAGFHELFPPAPEPIAAWQRQQARMNRSA